MATKLKRFTISVTPDIETELNNTKKEYFYNTTQSKMIRELITYGLKTFKSKNKQVLTNKSKSA